MIAYHITDSHASAHIPGIARNCHQEVPLTADGGRSEVAQQWVVTYAGKHTALLRILLDATIQLLVLSADVHKKCSIKVCWFVSLLQQTKRKFLKPLSEGWRNNRGTISKTTQHSRLVQPYPSTTDDEYALALDVDVDRQEMEPAI